MTAKPWAMSIALHCCLSATQSDSATLQSRQNEATALQRTSRCTIFCFQPSCVQRSAAPVPMMCLTKGARRPTGRLVGFLAMEPNKHCAHKQAWLKPSPRAKPKQRQRESRVLHDDSSSTTKKSPNKGKRKLHKSSVNNNLFTSFCSPP